MAAKKKSSARRKTTSKRTSKTKSTTRRKTTAKKSRTTTKRKSTVKRKATTKKTTTKKSSKAKLVRPKVGKKPYTKSELVTALAADSELDRNSVRAVLSSLEGVIQENLVKAKTFNLHGVCKMIIKKKPATKARKGINPFTGEEMMFKAKPASQTVRIRPLKNLKEAVS